MNPYEIRVRVVIADSQYLVTESLKSILQSDGRFNVIKVSGVSELIMFSIRAGWIDTIEYHI